MLLPVHQVRVDIVEAVQHYDFRVDRKSHPPEEFKNLVMFGEFRSADNFAKLITPERKVAARCNGSILLPKRPSSGISRIDVGLLPRFDLRCIEFLECRDRHVDLSANFKNFRTSFWQSMRDSRNRLHVRSDVFTNATIAAGRRLNEYPIFVAN
ncbi:unannotated protein [freshwater metagenome]|uniref:Unannotated protein n=1 Tax=freshwater metagenome TaxID=449393 RepID=A0A6J6PQ34_9ZZZZ